MAAHGTNGSYQRGCHCEECRAYKRDQARQWRARLKAAQEAPSSGHGLDGYMERDCRCAPCTEAYVAFRGRLATFVSAVTRRR